MKYDVQIYINDGQLPLFGRENLSPSQLVQYLSVVLYRQALLHKKLFRISVMEHDDSSYLLKQATINFPPFVDLVNEKFKK